MEYDFPCILCDMTWRYEEVHIILAPLKPYSQLQFSG